MKRGTPDHHKMKRLAHLSRVPRPYALAWANGAMERLWHYAARYAIRGDIGRITNIEIAEVCCYPRKRADDLIEILIESGWLDRHPDYRLVIHDWSDHADESTRKTIKNRGLNFVPPAPTRKLVDLTSTAQWGPENRTILPKFVRTTDTAPNKQKDLQATFPESFQTFPDSLSFPEPSSTVVTEEAVHTHTNSTQGARAKNSITNGAQPPAPALKRLDEFLANYPDKSDPDSTARSYISHVTPEREAACHACLARYNASDRVARNVVQRGRNWLEQQSRNGFTGQWTKPVQPNKKPTMVENVRRLIGESLAKGEKPW